jgi:hypothetical protein
MKKFIVRIGYEYYAVDNADAVALLDTASRMKAVKQDGYTGPYLVKAEQEPCIDTMTMAEVAEPEQEPASDKFSTATAEAAVF